MGLSAGPCCLHDNSFGSPNICSVIRRFESLVAPTKASHAFFKLFFQGRVAPALRHCSCYGSRRFWFNDDSQVAAAVVYVSGDSAVGRNNTICTAACYYNSFAAFSTVNRFLQKSISATSPKIASRQSLMSSATSAS